MKTFLIITALLCLATCQIVQKCECNTLLVPCSQEKKPVCGIKYCDGKQVKETYQNECLACSIGNVEFTVEGCCEYFPCDAYFCNPFESNIQDCGLSTEPQCAYPKNEQKYHNESNGKIGQNLSNGSNGKNQGIGNLRHNEGNQFNANIGNIKNDDAIKLNQSIQLNVNFQDNKPNQISEVNGKNENLNGKNQNKQNSQPSLDNKRKNQSNSICPIDEPNQCTACRNRDILYVVSGCCPKI